MRKKRMKNNLIISTNCEGHVKKWEVQEVKAHVYALRI